MTKITASFSFFLTNIQPPVDYTEVSLNISFIEEFWFIESLEQAFLTGELVLLDKDGFLETINFTGKEIIKVIIQQEFAESESKMDTYRKVIEFEIFEVQVEDIRPKNAIFRIRLIEKGGWDLYGKNFSKSYRNKKISEIVEDVFQNQLKLKRYQVEPTIDILENFTIPFWKPILTIKHLKKKARKSGGLHEGGYIFYSSTETGSDENNIEPKKYFISLSSLFEKTFVDTDLNKYLLKSPTANPYFINSIKESGAPALHRKSVLRDGIGGKTYYGIDYNTDKNFLYKSTTFSEYFNNAKTIAKKSFFGSDVNSKTDEVDFIAGQDFVLDATMNSNMRQLMESYYTRIHLVEGALFRYAGQIIWVEENSDKTDGLYHKHNTGKWLIRDITHQFRSGFYTQKLFVVKDSYEESDVVNIITKA